jgi:predicted nuclease of predicted toxin-antitoxin system
MRFLANENFPALSISFLREIGLEIISIFELYRGSSDYEVIELAQAQNLIILTFDKDYGEIIFKYGIENPPPVIFFRYKGESPQVAGDKLLELLKNKDIKIEGRFTVVEKDSIRQRTY